MIILAIIGFFSLAMNMVAVWYIYSLLKKYYPISGDLEDLFELLEEYHFHIKSVTQMESFYGEPILMNLLRHSRAIKEEVDKFRTEYSILYEIGDEKDSEFDKENRDSTDENEEDEDVPTPLEQEVFGVVQNRR